MLYILYIILSTSILSIHITVLTHNACHILIFLSSLYKNVKVHKIPLSTVQSSLYLTVICTVLPLCS